MLRDDFLGAKDLHTLGVGPQGPLGQCLSLMAAHLNCLWNFQIPMSTLNHLNEATLALCTLLSPGQGLQTAPPRMPPPTGSRASDGAQCQPAAGHSWFIRAVAENENDQWPLPLNDQHPPFLPPAEVKLLVKFLKEIPEGALVLVASYDDPGTR